MGPESKLYKKITKEWSSFSFTRLENISLLGTPDLLVYNNNKHFFTLELKVTKGIKVKFSPHQIAFHVTHPKNSFILVQTLGPRSANRFQLYPGSGILALQNFGRDLEPFCLGLETCRDFFYSLGA